MSDLHERAKHAVQFRERGIEVADDGPYVCYYKPCRIVATSTLSRKDGERWDSSGRVVSYPELMVDPYRIPICEYHRKSFDSSNYKEYVITEITVKRIDLRAVLYP